MNATRRAQPTRSGQSRSFEGRRKRRMILGAVAGAAALFSWMFVFYRVSHLPSLAITDVHIYGAEANVTPTLRAAAYRTLQGSYLGLFSRANAFLYPKEALVAAVTGASARVEGVTIKRDGLHSLTIGIFEKAPAAVACAGLPDFDDTGVVLREPTAEDGCYFTDESGYLFRKVPQSVPQSYNRYYVPDISNDPVGQLAASTEEFHDLETLMKGVRESGIIPEAILIKPEGEYELYVHNPRTARDIHASSTAIIYINKASPFASQLSNLSAFWNGMASKARAAGSRLDFEYIDVRSGSNVFYRLIQ